MNYPCVICTKEGDRPSPRGDNSEIVNIHWKFSKIFFSRTSMPKSIKRLGTNYLWWREFKFVQIKGQALFKPEIITEM
jgi:hypothetical protein